MGDVLSVHQVSSHDAAAAARYFRTVVETELEARASMGSYYASEQAAGGQAFGARAALEQLGMAPGRIDGHQLERLLKGLSAEAPDRALNPERFAVDVPALERQAVLNLKRLGRRATVEQRDAVAALLRTTARAKAPAALLERHAATLIDVGLFAKSSLPMVERTVRTAGTSLDHASLRRSIEEQIDAVGGRSRLPKIARDAADALLDHMDIGRRRNPERDVKRQAQILEQHIDLDLRSHYRPTINSQDLTFSVPKSVSVFWSAASPDQRAAIEQAVVASAQTGVDYMARSIPSLQRKQHDGTVQMEAGIGVAATSFLHYTARAVGELDEHGRPRIDEHGRAIAGVPDPQLHVHCLVSGVLRDDGKLVAPNQREWVKHGREGGSLFRLELATRLRELGLPIEMHTGSQGRYFELAGVPAELCRSMSQRAELIETQLDAFRASYDREPTPAERDAIVTRSRMTKTQAAVELDDHWRATCVDHGLDADAVDRMFDQRQIGIARGERREQMIAAGILARIEQRGATVDDRVARSIAFEVAAGALTKEQVVELLDSMQERGQLIALDAGQVTTCTVDAAERACVDALQRPARAATARMLERGLERTERHEGFTLSEEQRDAITRSVGDRAVNVVVGLPGSGKGSVVRGVSEVVRAGGHGVVAVATQGARATGAGEQAGVQSRTIESLLASCDRGTLYVQTNTGRRLAREGDTVIVDEAGMVDTFTMRRVLDQLERRGMRAVLVGDPAQLDAIGVGGILRPMAERIVAPELTEIHRARHEWLRDMQTCLRARRADAALAVMRAHDAAHLHDTTRNAIDAMLDGWDAGRRDVGNDQAVMIVHSSNKVVDQVNLRAQQIRRDAGELGEIGVRSPDRSYLLHTGDRVMFRDRAYEVAGDRRVENGTRGVIIEVDAERRRATVRVNEPNHDPRDVVVELDECRALRLAYASHVYPAQGDTNERTFELAGGQGTANAASYDGASRTRERHDLYTSRELLEAHTDHDCWERLAAQMNERVRNEAGISYSRDSRRVARAIPVPAIVDHRHEVSQARRLLTRADNQMRELEDAIARELRARRDVTAADRRVSDAAALTERRRLDFDEAAGGRALTPAARARLARARAAVAGRLEAAELALEQSRNERSLLLLALAPMHDTTAHLVDALTAARTNHARAERRFEVARAGLADAALLDPPRYLTDSLGPRPAALGARDQWDAAARDVVRYRSEHAIDTTRAPLGRRPSAGPERTDWERGREALERAQVEIGREPRTVEAPRHDRNRSGPIIER